MSTIVAIKTEDRIWMGADRQSTDGTEKRTLANGKIALKHVVVDGTLTDRPILIGLVGFHRSLTIMKYNFQPPAFPEEWSPEEYLGEFFIPAWKACLKENECIEEFGKSKMPKGDTLLVGYQGVLAMIGSDFALSVYKDGYDAIGSGYEYALGALRVFFESGATNAEQSIERSLGVASYFDPGTGSEFQIESIPIEKERRNASNE